MTFWGSVDDASKAKKFVLVDPDTPFPPPKEIPPTTSTTTTRSSTSSSKQLPKPTANLPGDHGEAEGEKDKPAFTTVTTDGGAKATSSPSPSETLTPTPDEGWFPGMYNLVTNSKWVFGAIGAVAIFGLATAGYFLYRRRARRRGAYASLGDEDLQMGAFDARGGGNGGRTRTRELYDAFGEVSDDDDDYADEETGLRRPLAAGAGGGLDFHSEFLEDDPETARTPEPLYQDEPVPAMEGRQVTTEHAHEGTRSPGSGSMDGSWEHASDATR